jgi:hypothetical protein
MEHNPLSVWRRAQTARGVPRRPSEGEPYFPDRAAVALHRRGALIWVFLKQSR